MSRTYYLFNPGRLSRDENSLKFEMKSLETSETSVKRIPIEDVTDLFIFGSLDANSALYNFLGKKNIAVHFFDYYEHYTGSFLPKEYLLSGRVIVNQVKTYLNNVKRLAIARKFIVGGSFNILKNLKYYNSRGRDLKIPIEMIESLSERIDDCQKIFELMGIEGNIRNIYYSTFDIILNEFTMGNRSKRPPMNEVNALISFGNALCYAAVVGNIYHTQLNPTISFLHEPGERRFSLALDIAEIFKPILVDRIIFKVLNKKEIQEKDFVHEMSGCTLKEEARKKFVRVFEDRLSETIEHRELKRKISYKHLIKLECYKIQKDVLGIREYKPFKIWW